MSNSFFTKNGEIAIVQPQFKKIEAEVQGGIARISQRVTIIESSVVMGYELKNATLKPGDTVLLRADAGLQPWAKQVYTLNDNLSFCLCPESAILGYRISDAK
jgi:hypothetical protein